MIEGSFRKFFLYPIMYNTLSLFGSLKKAVLNNTQFYILSYHRVLDLKKGFNFYRDVITTTPEDFYDQINYISEKYNIVSFNELYDILQNGDYRGDKLMILTFDDEYVDFSTNVLPILKEYDVGATIFITPLFASNKIIGWWETISYAINNANKNKLNIPEIKVSD